MSAIPQQVLDRQKASVNTFVAAQAVVFSGFEKLVELNLKVVKATLDEVAQKSQQAAEVKDPQEAAAFATGLLQPGAEKALAYSKHVYDIVAGVQGKLVKLTEEQIAEGQQQLSEAVEHSRRTPRPARKRRRPDQVLAGHRDQRLRFADQGRQAGRRSRRVEPECRRQRDLQGCLGCRRCRQGCQPQPSQRLSLFRRAPGAQTAVM